MSRIHSMTGFASGSGTVDGRVPFTLTIKSVNHRFLDLHMRLPSGCEELEMHMRRLLKERLGRGHVEVTLTSERGEGAGIRLNQALLAAYIRVFRETSLTFGLQGEPELNALLRMPGVMSSEAPVRAADLNGLEAGVMPVLAEVLTSLNGVRGQEGAALAAVLGCSMGRILRFAAEVSSLRDGVRSAQFDRLRQRLAESTGGLTISEDRVLAEAAILAERSDVEEELVRLRTHAERFLTLLEEGGEMGKRGDFLLQELNREANTMLSKTGATTGESGLRVTELGLEIKAEIERAREQVQNLE